MPPTPTTGTIELMQITEPPPAAFMSGSTACVGEELVAEVDGDALVEIARASPLSVGVPVVAGGVVDEHGDRPDHGADLRDRRLQRVDVAEVGRARSERAPAPQPAAIACARAPGRSR